MSDTAAVLGMFALLIYASAKWLQAYNEWEKRRAAQRPYISPRRVRRLIKLVDELEER